MFIPFLACLSPAKIRHFRVVVYLPCWRNWFLCVEELSCIYRDFVRFYILKQLPLPLSSYRWYNIVLGLSVISSGSKDIRFKALSHVFLIVHMLYKPPWFPDNKGILSGIRIRRHPRVLKTQLKRAWVMRAALSISPSRTVNFDLCFVSFII